MFFYFYRYRSQYGTIAFVQVTGFEQVDTNGIPNYYVFDHNPSRVVQFDQNWNNVKNNRLPYQYGYNLKMLMDILMSLQTSIFPKLT